VVTSRRGVSVASVSDKGVTRASKEIRPAVSHRQSLFFERLPERIRGHHGVCLVDHVVAVGTQRHEVLDGIELVFLAAGGHGYDVVDVDRSPTEFVAVGLG